MFWYGSKKRQLIDFANKTAEELYSSVPPALLEHQFSVKTKKKNKQFEKGLENAIFRIAQYKATQKPGIYGKAKLHQVFAARLKELGYPNVLANEINQHILIKTP